MRAVLRADGRAESGGGGTLVMSNSRLADPLDPFTRALKTLTGKKSKTDADHLEIARLDFIGNMHTDPVIPDPGQVNGQVPVLYADNFLRCLYHGATRTKRGEDVKRGVLPLAGHGTLEYEGELTHAEEMWRDGSYALRAGVVVSKRMVYRTRPVFTDWQASLAIEVDPVIFNRDALEACWAAAGRYEGLGSWRPRHGRFVGTIEWSA